MHPLDLKALEKTKRQAKKENLMNKTLEKRVKKIEGKVFINETEERTRAIFFRVVDASREGLPIEEQEKTPVKGWELNGYKWLRAEGETNKELEDRAIEGAQDLLNSPLSVPCFIQVQDDQN